MGPTKAIGPSRERAGEARTVLDGVGRLRRVAYERLGAAAALVVVDQLLVAHRGLGEPVLRADAERAVRWGGARVRGEGGGKRG